MAHSSTSFRTAHRSLDALTGAPPARYPLRTTARAVAEKEDAARAARSLASLFESPTLGDGREPSHDPLSPSDSLSWAAHCFEVAAGATDPHDGREVKAGWAADESLGWAAGCWLLAQGPSPPDSPAEVVPTTEAHPPRSPPRRSSPAPRPSRLSPALLAAVSPLCDAASCEGSEAAETSTPLIAAASPVCPVSPLAKPKQPKAPAIGKKRRRKIKDAAWPGEGRTRKKAANGKSASKLRTDADGYRQPRGRPPHGVDGQKMLWDGARGLWVHPLTGKPRDVM